MKKILLICMTLMLMFGLIACEAKDDEVNNKIENTENTENTKNTENNAKEAENTKEKPQDDKNASAWPAEFNDWGVPVLNKGVVAISDNRSVSDGMMTKGEIAIVNVKNVSKADFDDYCKELEGIGFTKRPESLEDVILYYEKETDNGIIKITLSFSGDTITIIVDNSGAKVKNAEDQGELKWPESLKGIPVFTKGNYKETVEMGGGMYAITFTGVSNADMDQYRSTLKNAGFISQENEDAEGYMKFVGDNSWSVGFNYSGDTLQLIMIGGQQ